MTAQGETAAPRWPGISSALTRIEPQAVEVANHDLRARFRPVWAKGGALAMAKLRSRGCAAMTAMRGPSTHGPIIAGSGLCTLISLKPDLT